MAVVDMQKVSICAPKRNRKDVLEALQGMGIMEIHEEDIPAGARRTASRPSLARSRSRVPGSGTLRQTARHTWTQPRTS